MIENIKITEFAKRHFDPKFGGTKILDFTPNEFESFINELNKEKYINVLPGYADFCKLLVVENFTNAKTGTLPITLENYQYLRSGYSARTESELPIMERWFELPLSAPKANYLVIVLYSKEQLEKEATYGYVFDGNWGVVSILAQISSKEEPMKPITMMRNALGIEEGGSGVPIDREAYKKSVEFWNGHAMVK